MTKPEATTVIAYAGPTELGQLREMFLSIPLDTGRELKDATHAEVWQLAHEMLAIMGEQEAFLRLHFIMLAASDKADDYHFSEADLQDALFDATLASGKSIWGATFIEIVKAAELLPETRPKNRLLKLAYFLAARWAEGTETARRKRWQHCSRKARVQNRVGRQDSPPVATDKVQS